MRTTVLALLGLILQHSSHSTPARPMSSSGLAAPALVFHECPQLRLRGGGQKRDRTAREAPDLPGGGADAGVDESSATAAGIGSDDVLKPSDQDALLPDRSSSPGTPAPKAEEALLNLADPSGIELAGGGKVAGKEGEWKGQTEEEMEKLEHQRAQYEVALPLLPPHLFRRVVCERNRDTSRTRTPAGGLSL